MRLVIGLDSAGEVVAVAVDLPRGEGVADIDVVVILALVSAWSAAILALDLGGWGSHGNGEESRDDDGGELHVD